MFLLSSPGVYRDLMTAPFTDNEFTVTVDCYTIGPIQSFDHLYWWQNPRIKLSFTITCFVLCNLTWEDERSCKHFKIMPRFPYMQTRFFPVYLHACRESGDDFDVRFVLARLTCDHCGSMAGPVRLMSSQPPEKGFLAITLNTFSKSKTFEISFTITCFCFMDRRHI